MCKGINKEVSLVLWYKNNKEVYQFDDLHIHFIIQNPHIFGLTTEGIEAIFERHGEPLGTEGKAREEILSEVFKSGWIRIRYSRIGVWFVEVDRYDKRKEKIRRCIEFLLKVKKEMAFDDKVRIIDKEGIQAESSIKKIYWSLVG